jgi:integrase
MGKMKNEIVEYEVLGNRNEKVKITQNVAKKAQREYKTKWVRDTDVPGFALRIQPSGAKSWTFGYRHKPSGKPKLHTIGTFNKSNLNDADDARRLAEQMRLALRDGKYPTNYAVAKTVKDIVDAYLKTKPRTKNSGPHRVCERIILPYAADLTLEEVDNPMVWRLRKKIAKKVSENSAGLFVTYLKAAWNNAIKFGHTKLINPCLKIDGVQKRKPDKKALTLKGYDALWSGLDHLSNLKGRNPFTTLAIELLAYTGNRKGEITDIEINHIDFEKRDITIAKHKNSWRKGESSEPLHIVYQKGSGIDEIVTKASKLRLEMDITVERSKYLFPQISKRGRVLPTTTYNNMDAQWKEIRKVEPILKEHRIKDMRSGWITFGSNTLGIEDERLAEANSRQDVAVMLRHYKVVPEVRKAYDSIVEGIGNLRKQL